MEIITIFGLLLPVFVLAFIYLLSDKIHIIGLFLSNLDSTLKNLFSSSRNNKTVNVVEAILEVASSGKEIAQAIRNHTVLISTTRTSKKDMRNETQSRN